MTSTAPPTGFAVTRHLRTTAQTLVGAALLVGSAAGWAQPAAADQGQGATVLIQRQGQQKQRLIQGQAATQLSQRQAKDLAQAAQPAASKPVTQADVELNRAERLRRLNAAKVDPSATP